MAGVAGRSGRKSKLAEWDYHEVVLSSDKHIKDAYAYLFSKIAEHSLEKILNTEFCSESESKPLAHLRRLFYKLLDIAPNFILKAMPAKIHGEGFGDQVTQITMKVEKANDESSYQLQAPRIAIQGLQGPDSI